MRRNSEAGPRRVRGGVGRNVGGIEVPRQPPHPSRREASLHDRRQATAAHVESIPLPDPAQPGVVGERLGQVVAEIPTQAQMVGNDRLSCRSERRLGPSASSRLPIPPASRITRRSRMLSLVRPFFNTLDRL
jgi:hypothetical protein